MEGSRERTIILAELITYKFFRREPHLWCARSKSLTFNFTIIESLKGVLYTAKNILVIMEDFIGFRYAKFFIG